MNVTHVRIELKPERYCYPEKDFHEVEVSVVVDAVKHTWRRILREDDLTSRFDLLMGFAVDELRRAITKPDAVRTA
jgi:hypothetical protein